MDHDFTPTWRPTFEDPRETSPLAQEYAVGDVVESAPALGPGLHPERLHEFSPRFAGVAPDRGEYVDHHNVSTPRGAPHTTTSTTPPTTTSTVAPAIGEVATTPTSGRRGVNSSSATVASVGSFANAPAENASSGALRGSITPALGVAVVPLAGPATWTLSASAALRAALQCGSQTVDVASPFVVGAGENCQLTLAPVTTHETVTWLLTPTT